MECTPAEFEILLEALHSEEYLQRSTSELRERTPEQSAFQVLSRAQVTGLWIAAAVAVLLFAFRPTEAGIVVMAGCMLFYMVFSVYRCRLIYQGLSHDLEVPVSPDELADLDESRLPVYTILVPLYREASVISHAAAGPGKAGLPCR